MSLYNFNRFAQVYHALAEFALNAAAFLLAHLIQTIEHFARAGHYRRLKRSILRVACRIEGTRNAQNRVEVGLGGHRKLCSRCPKSRDVSAYQGTIQRKGFVVSALHVERNLDVPTGNLFLEQAPKLHLKRVGTRGQAEVQIEETMIYRLQRKREGQVTIALVRGECSWRRTHTSLRLVCKLAFDLRKTCHGADRHE